LLKKARRVDGYSGRTTKGPHKTDLVAWHPLKSMPAGQCSTGEQKALLIAIILGAVRLQISARDRSPLLLLDELAAHLDEGRRRALFDEISDLGIQTWMTGTDAGLFAPLKGRATFFHVEDGTIAEMKNA
ncbi:MAG: DNA replication and repair protein RecF, partial [Sphingomonadales bacterium]